MSLTFNQLLGRDTGWKIQVPLDNGWTLMLSLHHLYHTMETVYRSATHGFISLSQGVPLLTDLLWQISRWTKDDSL